jgi:hypothetical protein
MKFASVQCSVFSEEERGIGNWDIGYLGSVGISPAVSRILRDTSTQWLNRECSSLKENIRAIFQIHDFNLQFFDPICLTLYRISKIFIHGAGKTGIVR